MMPNMSFRGRGADARRGDQGAPLAQMVHLSIIAPADLAEEVLGLLLAAGSVVNVARFAGAARKPPGDVILCDIPRSEASMVIEDLRGLGIPPEGSISIAATEAEPSQGLAGPGHGAGPRSDGIVWEEVEAETADSAELSAGFLVFMVLATIIATVGIVLDEPVLIVGAMILGPELGPIVGLSVAAVERRRHLVWRSAVALLVGFPIGIVAATIGTLALRWAALIPDELSDIDRPLTNFIAHPDEFSLIVALAAGIAAALAVGSTRLSPLVGVVVSVVTIPAAANTGVAAAFGEWGEAAGAQAQLWANVAAVIVAATPALELQRRAYLARRRRR